MKNDLDMLKAAQAGYAGDLDNPALFSSAIWFAHVAGRAMARIQNGSPVKVQMSRGYSVKLQTADGRKWLVRFATDYLVPQNPECLA